MSLSNDLFIDYFYPSGLRGSISPICVSPWIQNQKSLGIKVVLNQPTDSADSAEHEEHFVNFPKCKVITDKDCFYKITNYDKISLMIKISLNASEWAMPAFFPYKFVRVALGRPFIFVALEDFTINIIDSETGVVTFPQILVTSDVVFLSADGYRFTCVSSDQMLRIWEISPTTNRLLSLIKTRIETNVGNIHKIELTNELEDDSISPIIFGEYRTLRYSKLRDSWYAISRDHYSPKNKLSTLYDVKLAFKESLLLHEADKFTDYLSILIRKYILYGKIEKVLVLVKQNLEIIGSDTKSYCGIDPKELLQIMLDNINAADPNLAAQINEMPEFLAAFAPRPFVEAKEVGEDKIDEIIKIVENEGCDPEYEMLREIFGDIKDEPKDKPIDEISNEPKEQIEKQGIKVKVDEKEKEEENGEPVESDPETFRWPPYDGYEEDQKNKEKAQMNMVATMLKNREARLNASRQEETANRGEIFGNNKPARHLRFGEPKNTSQKISQSPSRASSQNASQNTSQNASQNASQNESRSFSQSSSQTAPLAFSQASAQTILQTFSQSSSQTFSQTSSQTFSQTSSQTFSQEFSQSSPKIDIPSDVSRKVASFYSEQSCQHEEEEHCQHFNLESDSQMGAQPIVFVNSLEPTEIADKDISFFQSNAHLEVNDDDEDVQKEVEKVEDDKDSDKQFWQNDRKRRPRKEGKTTIQTRSSLRKALQNV